MTNQVRGLEFPILRVGPKLATMTVNSSAMTALGRPRQILFHYLGNGKVIVESYVGGKPTKTALALADSGTLVASRVVKLCGYQYKICRVPWFLVQFGSKSVGSHVGRQIFGGGVFFDFDKNFNVDAIDLSSIIAEAPVGEKTTFEDALKKKRQRPKVVAFDDTLELDAPKVSVRRKKN